MTSPSTPKTLSAVERRRLSNMRTMLAGVRERQRLVDEALLTAHAVIREGIHDDRRFQQEALEKIEKVLGFDPAKENGR